MAIVKAYKHINNPEDILRVVQEHTDGTYTMINKDGEFLVVRDIVLRRWYHRTAIEIQTDEPIVPDAAVIDTCKTNNSEYENLPQSVLYIMAAFQVSNYTTEFKKQYIKITRAGEKNRCCKLFFTKKGKITLSVKQDVAEKIVQKFGDDANYIKVPDSYGYALNYKVTFSNNFNAQWNTLSAKHVVDCF